MLLLAGGTATKGTTAAGNAGTAAVALYSMASQ
jgi:hypothetical protein